MNKCGEFRWHIHTVVLRHCFHVELEFGNVGFCGVRKIAVPGENPWRRAENQYQTQSTYGVNSRNRTCATLVGGECSHHCVIPGSPASPM